MKLVRCTEQPGSLESFYEASSPEDDHGSAVGKTMLSLLGKLRELPDDCQAWGLTSHFALWLLNEDRGDSVCWVRVVARFNEYSIEYRMPDATAPWPEAYVSGRARSEAQAVQMIRTAMLCSGGWTAPSR